MNALELFSGSCHFSQVSESLGFDAWSVDINKKLNPRVCCNILDFNPQLFPSSFDIVWASPDCSTFSRQAYSGLWDKKVKKYRVYSFTPISEKSKLGLALLLRTIDIIKYYSPQVWFIENPVGRMRHIVEMQQFAPFRYSVNYKDWGFDYSKETDIYTNQYLNLPQKKVIRPGRSVADLYSKYARSVVPKDLIKFLILNSSLFN